MRARMCTFPHQAVPHHHGPTNLPTERLPQYCKVVLGPTLPSQSSLEAGPGPDVHSSTPGARLQCPTITGLLISKRNVALIL
jgi:hypothetical protein